MVIEEARYTYPTQLTNSFDRENWTVSTDHCYARPWNWRPEANFLRPTKTLFIPKLVPIKSSDDSTATIGDTEEIDIETESEVPAPNYDVSKARSLMDECEKYALNSRNETEEDWEEKITRLHWTTGQHKLFNSMVNILNNYNLSKLAYSGSLNEPLLRRTVIDKAVQRVRRLMASILWEPKLTQWLHQLLIDYLSPQYLGCYLDILQSLKSKLPTFVDKMMHGSTSLFRSGNLNPANLSGLLEKPWDPLSNTLMQDKLKKLPGNPVIVVVPSGPIMSKLVHKWIKLLNNLATVISVPTNFGSTGHRMTMPSILDQLFSLSRGKIQEVRDDYPGRNIILVGFNSGAALALQLAQVEPVFCVVSIGFSLLTAEGPRGEPDDNLLELQCPVLFVIGQCSNTSNQEDLEEMRERMRVETGLLVVGSADDYLRVSKKKRRQEGITQSIVDRCIVDEIGEFISGLILSPYPPQIRQSPAHVPPEIQIKKGNAERKRYSSNTSSLDSEPPSPTTAHVRINNRTVGRPPGSKSKNRLEAKWAQQIAQGNQALAPSSVPASSPNSPPSNSPAIASSDNSSSGTTNDDKPASRSVTPKQSEPQPIKKIKTLKPVQSNADSKTPNQSARMHVFGMNRNAVQGNTSVSNLLQGGIKTIPPSVPKPSTSGIKVLENVTLNSTSTGKLIPNRTIDLSKITLINSSKTPNTSVSNVLLLPDGKIKTIGPASIKSGSPLLLPLSPQKATPKTSMAGPPKYITAKRQLMNQKPPRPIKKPVYMPTPNAEQSLPPPTNLTTQDIMDLPIIFADDNQILATESNSTSTSTIQVPQMPKTIQSVAPAKFMLVNKQSLGQNNFILTSNIKKGTQIGATTTNFNKPPPKYTKIILSSRKNNLDELKAILSPDKKEIKMEDGSELVDLENEIKATTVPKPILSDFITIKSSGIELAQKRPSTEMAEETTDPDYLPPKNLKME